MKYILPILLLLCGTSYGQTIQADSVYQMFYANIDSQEVVTGRPKATRVYISLQNDQLMSQAMVSYQFAYTDTSGNVNTLGTGSVALRPLPYYDYVNSGRSVLYLFQYVQTPLGITYR